LALDVSECCAALGCSWDFWSEHVAPEVRIVRRGRRKLIAVAELERWLDENAHAVLDPRGATPTRRDRSGTYGAGVVKKTDRVLGVLDGI
jgi:acetyl-CoA carboxylase carboxyltransferase component